MSTPKKPTTIIEETDKFIKFLEDSSLLTDEHALSVSLLRQLVKKLDDCTNMTQYAALSKEIRATQEALPKPLVKQTDEVQDFFDELEDLSK